MVSQAGYALKSLKDYPAAIRQLEQAVRLKPTDTQAHFFLGQLHLYNRDRPSALAQYRTITSLDAEMANKLYAAIYAGMVVTAKRN